MSKIVSGIQPTNNLTLGNYLGSIINYVKLQQDNELIIFIADLHAITTNNYDHKNLLNAKRNLVRFLIGSGVDYEKNIIFNQSDVKEHALLGHYLMCQTTLGELNRMTQFKDKSQKCLKQANNTEMIPTGLLIYPTLMAADILLYNPKYVPVGNDQKQHLELTRNIANRINNKFNQDFFEIPDILLTKFGSRVMDLQNPEVKMSKSSINQKGVIFLSDNEEEIRKKIKSAKTDCLNKVKFDIKNQPGISNLISIYCALTNSSIEEVEAKYENIQNYGVFKSDVADVVVNTIINIQKNANLLSDKEIDKILEIGAKRASEIATKNLYNFEKMIGIR